MLQTGLSGCRAFFHFRHVYAAYHAFDIVFGNDVRRNFAEAYAENGALHCAVGLDVGYHFLDYRGRDGERAAGVSPCLGVYGSVDADQFAVEVNQGSAGVATVNGRVGLYVRLYAALRGFAGHTRYVAGLGADNARCHGGGEAERIAYGEHPFAHAKLLAVAHRDYVKVGGVDLYKSQICGGVEAYYRRREVAVVVECYFEAFGVGNDVVVGNDVPVAAYYHARAEPCLLLAGLLGLCLRRVAATRRAEKEVEKRVVVVFVGIVVFPRPQRSEALDAYYAVYGVLRRSGKVVLRYQATGHTGVGRLFRIGARRLVGPGKRPESGCCGNKRCDDEFLLHK